MKRSRLFLASGIVVLMLIGAVVIVASIRSGTDKLLAQGRAAFDRGRFRDAERLARQALRRDSSSTAAALLAGQSALALRKPQQAYESLGKIPDDGTADAVTARLTAGEILLFHLHELGTAEDQFRRVLQQDAANGLANDRLSYILGLQSRSWESIPYRLALIRYGQIDRIRLFVLSMGNLALENPDEIERYHQAAAADPGPLTGLARVAMHDHNWDRAEALLRQAIATHPEFAEAQAKLGEVLRQRDDKTAFVKWHHSLPSSADKHPGIWAARGTWALEKGVPRVAVRCLWEAVRRNPCDQPNNYRLGQALLAVDREAEANEFFERSDALQKYLYHCHMVHIAPERDNLTELENAASAAYELGLMWEAYAWTKLAVRQDDNLEWAERLLQGVPVTKLPENARMIPEKNLAANCDFSEFPLLDWSGMSPDDNPSPSQPQPDAVISFIDQAAAAGILFTYYNGARAEAGPAKLYEQLGGGVAAIDYDADGWCDLYFTQGCDWPSEKSRGRDFDRLFRNNGDGTFEDVTFAANLHEDRFGQGVASGDVNNDGFSDLYVANLGQNRLLLNNGDGTYTDATDSLPSVKPGWSTSCAVADLNGDGLPDIYTVNYLSGDDLFTRKCQGPDGRPAPCRIQEFSAAFDTLFLNSGDGDFAEVSRESGIQVPDGRGLGVVVADFLRDRRSSLFIANDVSPNFFFESPNRVAVPIPKFTEQALPLGLAASSTGSYEACMGVAVGDANGDGRLDLFVTNFYQESNTLYLQDQTGGFRDATQSANLAASSMQTLGFGTQFLDGDLDGDLDLIVTNGHINDLSAQDIPYRMKPQFYSNDGHGRFQLAFPTELGPFFEERTLGRGLARFDWNRDGREDAVISHIESSAALLTNSTQGAGQSVTIHLRGVESSRDAIGTTVTANVAGSKLVRQLSAGDGFHASNQHCLTFGLGAEDHIDQIEVHWPSGQKLQLKHIASGKEYLLIEGNSTIWPLIRELQ